MNRDRITNHFKPIRILHNVIGGMNVGGIETMLMEIYRNIDRRKYQFDFVIHYYDKNVYEDEILSMGGVLHYVPFYSENPTKHNKQFRKLLEEHPEYQIVHIHTTYAIMYSDAKIAKNLGRTVVIHSHNSNATKLHRLYHYFYRNRFAKLADCRLSCSYIAGEWMYGKSYPYDIWKNPIRTDRFKFNSEKRHQIRSELQIDEDTLLIGNVGRLSYQKNQELLLYIYAEYAREYPNSKLILVGDGEDRHKLEKKVEELNLASGVIFKGNVSNVNDYLMAIDVFCLTSRWEGFGVAMVEAVTAGVMVVVATALVDALVKQLDNVVIVEQYHNLCLWVDKIKEIKPLSEDERCRCYEKTIEQGFDISSQVKKVEEFYQKLLIEEDCDGNKIC